MILAAPRPNAVDERAVSRPEAGSWRYQPQREPDRYFHFATLGPEFSREAASPKTAFPDEPNPAVSLGV